MTPENSSFSISSISETRAKIEQAYQESTGQKMQAKATPIREGVLLIDKHHTAKDLKELGDKLEQRFGIKTIQGYVHKDEGHYNKETKEWKPNYHAHMVFQWTDDKGKSIKLNREDMAEMQTIVADHLNMERGQASTKKHIESREYKALKVQEDIKYHTQKLGVIEASKKQIKEVDNIKVTKSGFLGSSIDHEKTSEKLREALKSQILSSNIDYVNQIKEKDLKLDNIEKTVGTLLRRFENYKKEPTKLNELKVEVSSLQIKSTATIYESSRERVEKELKSVSSQMIGIMNEEEKQNQKTRFKGSNLDQGLSL